MPLCYHCGADRDDPHWHKGLPYCGLCAIKFGFLEVSDVGSGGSE